MNRFLFHCSVSLQEEKEKYLVCYNELMWQGFGSWDAAGVVHKKSPEEDVPD